MGDMTPTLLLAVSCPTCGAAAGKACLLHSGRLRNELHIDRKLCAIEAVERKRSPVLVDDQLLTKRFRER